MRRPTSTDAPMSANSVGFLEERHQDAAARQLQMECRLRHEMRGIAIHRPTRRVVCRPYHKFWHVGQRGEQLSQELTELANAPALPLIEKLDGVMVQAFMVDGRVYLATRSGRTTAAVDASCRDAVCRHE